MQVNINEFPKHPLPHVPPEPQQPQRPVNPQTVYVYEKQRWEYRMIARNPDDAFSDDELNALGKEGWELTGVVSLPAKTQFYFKRLQS